MGQKVLEVKFQVTRSSLGEIPAKSILGILAAFRVFETNEMISSTQNKSNLVRRPFEIAQNFYLKKTEYLPQKKKQKYNKSH